jgi:hypothetical protein
VVWPVVGGRSELQCHYQYIKKFGITLSFWKCLVFVWRLVQDKVATKDNLATRRITYLTLTQCVGGRAVVKLKQLDTLFKCPIFSNVWSEIVNYSSGWAFVRLCPMRWGIIWFNYWVYFDVAEFYTRGYPQFGLQIYG